MQVPRPVKLTLGYFPIDEPDDFGGVMFVEADGHAFGFGAPTSGPAAKILVAVAERLQDNFAELREAWGEARPACPMHTHPLEPIERGCAAWWVCPRSGEPVAPIGRYTGSELL
jgi:hypothetical protein